MLNECVRSIFGIFCFLSYREANHKFCFVGPIYKYNKLSYNKEELSFVLCRSRFVCFLLLGIIQNA